MRPGTLSELADDVEVFTSRRVPAAVATVIAAHYTPEEAGVLYVALGRIHLDRTARSMLRRFKRSGLTTEQAIPEVADAMGQSDGWVDKRVYPRGVRTGRTYRTG